MCIIGFELSELKTLWLGEQNNKVSNTLKVELRKVTLYTVIQKYPINLKLFLQPLFAKLFCYINRHIA